MLEQMRRQGASIFIYLIFGILIAVFVINFGPQNRGHESGGCSGTSATAISVDNSSASFTSYKVAYSNRFNGGRSKGKTYWALEALIRRELLAEAAEAQGLDTTSDMALDEVEHGFFFLAGHRLPGQWMTAHGNTDVGIDLFFDKQKFAAWVNELNVSRSSYLEEQARELLASVADDLWQGSVLVSRDEALAHFLFQNTTVTYDAVVFRPDAYRSAMRLTDADAERFLAAHEALVKARYTRDQSLYKGTKPQLHLRQIEIATPKPGDKAAARKKLDAARADVVAGKAKLADLARQLSTDEAHKASGGDLGWHTADNPLLADKALNDAVKQLKPGDTTPVIATDRAVYLITAEAKREGDLSFDQVKLEIAKDVAKDEWSNEKARRDAETALAEARGGTGKNLADMFPPEKGEMPEMTPEQKQELLQRINEGVKELPKPPPAAGSGSAGSAHAVRETWSKDEPAGWFAEEEKAGSGSGSGSGTGSATTAEDFSKDLLPAFGDVTKPSVQHVGPVTRDPVLPGVGSSKQAAAALFDELQPGMLGKRVYASDGNYALVQLQIRSAPRMEDFDKQYDEIVNEPCHAAEVPDPRGGPPRQELKCGMRAERARKLVEAYVKDRCEQLLKDGKIRPDPEYLRDTDENGKPIPSQYRPCMFAPQL